MAKHPQIPRRRSLASIFVALLVAVTATACDETGDGARSAESYLAEARQLVEKGQMRSAMIHAKNALRAAPDNIEARSLIANAFLNAGDAWNAEREFQKLRELGAPPETWLKPLSQAWIALGKSDRVLNELTLPDDAPAPDRAMLLSQRGRARAALQEWDAATALFEEAATLDPTQADAHEGLARLALSRGDLSVVETELTRAEILAPNSPEVLFLKGDLASLQGRLADAEAAYEALSGVLPGNPMPTISLARVQVRAGRIEQAEANVRQLEKSLPGASAVTYLQAAIAFDRKDFETADTLTSRLLSADPDNLSALVIAGASKYALQEYEQAAKFVAGYLADKPDDERAKRLYGAILYQMGQGEKAVDVLQPLAEAETEDAQLFSLIGRSALQARDLQVGRLYIEKAVALQPEDASAQAQLGTVKVSLGDTDAGLKNLENAVELDPTMDAAVFTLFATLLREQRFDKALELAKKIQLEEPNKALGYSMQGIAHIAQGDIRSARAALDRSLEIEPGAVDSVKNLSQLELAAKNPDGARDYLLQGIEHNPSNTELMLLLADLQTATGNEESARTWLNKAIEVTPTAPEPRIALAQRYLVDDNPLKALGIAQGALIGSPNDPELLKVIGQAQLMAHEFSDAADTFRRLVGAEPKSAHNHFLLATAYLNTNDRNRLIGSLEDVIERAPGHVESRLMLARLYVEEGRFEEAVDIYRPIKPSEGVDGRILEIEGLAALRQDKPADAAALLADGFKELEAPGRSLAIMLSEAQWRSGDREESQATLASWMADNPDDQSTRFLFASRAMDMGREQEAARELRAVIEVQPENWAARNNLAWALHKLGDNSAAIVEVRETLKGAGDQPPILDTAGVVFLANGNISESVDVLRKAVMLAPDVPTYRFHLARALVAKEHGAEASEHLRKALSSENAFPEREAAESLLKDMGE